MERSILDNILIFWEAVSLARLRGTPLAILLLDFEKAYDQVDWSFLEEVMRRMGFPEGWIRGISALYRSAHSQVLLAGDKGERFPISRSVRQGCPLAPTLFLFFAEAMSKTDEESENLHQQLLDREIDLATFLQKYKKLRTNYHKRALVYLAARTSSV